MAQIPFDRSFYKESADQSLVTALIAFYNDEPRNSNLTDLARAVGALPKTVPFLHPVIRYSVQAFDDPSLSDRDVFNVSFALNNLLDYCKLHPGVLDEISTSVVQDTVDALYELTSAERKGHLKAALLKSIEKPYNTEFRQAVCAVLDRSRSLIQKASAPFAVDDPVGNRAAILDNIHLVAEAACESGSFATQSTLDMVRFVTDLRLLSREPTVSQQAKHSLTALFEEIRKTVEDAVKENKTGVVPPMAQAMLAALPKQKEMKR